MWEGYGMRKPLLFLSAFVCVSAQAAIDGTVINRTTNKPQPGVQVTLIKPSQSGMQTLETVVAGDQGKFRLEKDQPGQGPQLIQSVFKGVTYNKLITPGVPTSNLELEVFESSNKPGIAEVAQHMILVQPSTSEVLLNETLIYRNTGNITYDDPQAGSMRFYLPPAANGQVRVNVTGPQGMAIERPAEKTQQDNVYRVSYPIKPGETRFDLSYVLPTGSPSVLHGRLLHKEGSTRLVAPAGVTLEGDNLVQLGNEPTTQAAIYEVKGTDFKVNISGIGLLRSANSAPDEDTGSPQIQQIQPRVYEKLPWIVAITLAILALGMALLYRASPTK